MADSDIERFNYNVNTLISKHDELLRSRALLLRIRQLVEEEVDIEHAVLTGRLTAEESKVIEAYVGPIPLQRKNESKKTDPEVLKEADPKLKIENKPNQTKQQSSEGEEDKRNDEDTASKDKQDKDKNQEVEDDSRERPNDTQAVTQDVHDLNSEKNQEDKTSAEVLQDGPDINSGNEEENEEEKQSLEDETSTVSGASSNAIYPEITKENDIVSKKDEGFKEGENSKKEPTEEDQKESEETGTADSVDSMLETKKLEDIYDADSIPSVIESTGGSSSLESASLKKKPHVEFDMSRVEPKIFDLVYWPKGGDCIEVVGVQDKFHFGGGGDDSTIQTDASGEIKVDFSLTRLHKLSDALVEEAALYYKEVPKKIRKLKEMDLDRVRQVADDVQELVNETILDGPVAVFKRMTKKNRSEVKNE